MTRLRFVTRLNPSKTEAGELAGYGNVTFAPMDALSDGLGGLDASLERPADELADGSYSYFAEGDLLLAKVTPCFENGKKALVTSLPNRIGFATSEVHVVRPNIRKIKPNYLRYLLSSETFRASGIASMTGTGGLRRISDNAIKDYLLPVSDLATQEAIAAFLDREAARIDKLIAKKERQVEVLREQKSAITRELIHNGFKAAEERVTTENRWFPLMPRGWRQIRMRFLFRAAKRQGMPNLDVLSVYRDFGVILKSSRDDNINKTPEDLSPYQLVEPGDLVINKMKAWQGSLGFSELRGITSPDYLVYRPVAPMIGRYMHHLLRTQPMPSLFLTISNGIRIDQWRLEHAKFMDVVVWLPSLAEQAEIAAAIDARVVGIDRIVRSVSDSIDCLENTAPPSSPQPSRARSTFAKIKRSSYPRQTETDSAWSSGRRSFTSIGAIRSLGG